MFDDLLKLLLGIENFFLEVSDKSESVFAVRCCARSTFFGGGIGGGGGGIGGGVGGGGGIFFVGLSKELIELLLIGLGDGDGCVAASATFVGAVTFGDGGGDGKFSWIGLLIGVFFMLDICEW